jgi:hypothetical protein
MTRDQAFAVVEANLDLLRPHVDHPDPEVRAIVGKRLDGSYAAGALPRIHGSIDEKLAIEKARCRAMRAEKRAGRPSRWRGLTGRGGAH